MITELDLLMRALASRTRLRLLALILRVPETGASWGPGVRPADMARALNLSPSAVSQHLRILLRLHLVRYWKRSSLKFYRPARVGPGSLRGRLLETLRRDLPDRIPPVFSESPQDARRRGIRRGRPRRMGEAEGPSLGTLWAHLTCYSHFRRILMLKFLQQHGSASIGALSEAADIHPLTTAYHVDKLVRRGELVAVDDGYRLTAAKPHPIRRVAHDAVRSGAGRSREEPGR